MTSRSRILAGLMLALIAARAQAGSAEGNGDVRYAFDRTIIVPSHVAAGSFEIAKDGTWFQGVAVTPRLVRISTAVTIPDKDVTLSAGTILGVASDSEHLIGCTLSRPLRYRLAYSEICLVDDDGDRVFDHWFRRFDDLIFNPRKSRVSRDDILPIPLTGETEVPKEEISSLQTAAIASVRLSGDGLRICIDKGMILCTSGSIRVKPKSVVQTVEIFGGVFDYSVSASKKLVIACRKQPVATELH